ncbi:Hsp20 family protein [Methanobacterium sp.]|uniref:Hsp20 family protein n=1 Tax=Methanobacterium sp. TaxID=2164 RepID=UPI002ABCC86B|nr:Hsp20 family protein [Methanobacterium sp.]MDY9922219.1 Hsp20 family protein [Methanobacterium sp.]
MDGKKTKLEPKGKDTKEEIISKASEVKDSVSEKGEEVKAKAVEVKDSVSEKGEEVKVKASETKDTVSDKGKEFRESASEKTEELRTTAEKMVNDVLKTLREKQEDLGKTINDYTAPTTPYVDLINTSNEFILIADLPGVEKDGLSVDVTNESVTITATFPEGMEGEDVNYIKRERGSGEVTRTLKLPAEIKIKEANANFEEYILTIKLPKEIAETQKLEIN